MALTKQQRQELHSKYNGKCAYCGCDITLKEMQADHIKPIYRNWEDGEVNSDRRGIDDISNMNPSCAPCNRWKSVYTIEEFRKEISLQYERLLKISAGFRMIDRYGIISNKVEPVVFYF